jgi:hypothetical protein
MRVNLIFVDWLYENLPIVLYGCQTWSPTLREESRMSVFENRVMRRTFGPERDEVARVVKKTT